MFKVQKKSESLINVELDEPLTGVSYSKIIIEVVKYILYQKQQIPLSYDTLLKYHANSKPTDRNFNMIKNLSTSLCNISDQLQAELDLEKDICDIKQIVILIGPTIISPKFCIKFEIPKDLLNSKEHLEYQHSHRKPLLYIMKNLLQCTEFQNQMTVPLGPTMTFILLEKKDKSKVSEYFLPKPQFVLPTHRTSYFQINLNFTSENNKNKCDCCKVVKIFNDSNGEECLENNENDKIYNKDHFYQWYQSREILKGFKFLR